MAATAPLVSEFEFKLKQVLSQGVDSVELVERQGVEYVIKFLKYSSFGVPNPNEIDIGSRLAHPHLGRIEYLYPQTLASSGHSLGLVMPNYRHSAARILALSKINPRARLKMLYKLIFTVNLLHQAGIIHLDLKPENIMIEGEEPIIIDFGSSRCMLGGVFQGKHNVMTPFFTPPEVMDGNYNYTTATDVWSLGMLAVFILTGRNFLSRTLNKHETRSFIATIPEIIDTRLEEIFYIWPSGALKNRAIELITSFLDLQFDQRPSLDEALRASVFREITCPPLVPLTFLSPTRGHDLPENFVNDISLLLKFFKTHLPRVPARCLFLAVDLVYRAASSLRDRIGVGKAGLRKRRYLLYACLQLALDAELHNDTRLRKARRAEKYFVPDARFDSDYATRITDAVVSLGLRGVIRMPHIYDTLSEVGELRAAIETHLLSPSDYTHFHVTELSPTPYTGDVDSLFD